MWLDISFFLKVKMASGFCREGIEGKRPGMLLFAGSDRIGVVFAVFARCGTLHIKDFRKLTIVGAV